MFTGTSCVMLRLSLTLAFCSIVKSKISLSLCAYWGPFCPRHGFFSESTLFAGSSSYLAVLFCGRWCRRGRWGPVRNCEAFLAAFCSKETAQSGVALLTVSSFTLAAPQSSITTHRRRLTRCTVLRRQPR